MSTFSVSGLNSGIDYQSLISNIIKLERRPIVNLEARKSTFNNRVSAYSTLSSKLSALKNAADALRTSSDFYAKSASVSDSTVLDATASNSVSAGTYSIAVNNLAQAHKITHETGLADKDTATVLAAGSQFSFTIDAANGESTKTITASSDLTLEQLASEINSQSYTGTVKVVASVVNTGTSSSPSYKLILASNTTGADYGITINSDDSILDLMQTSSSDSDSDGQYRVDLKSAQDASFSVDTLSVTRSSNTVTDVITGVTFTLKEAASGSVTLSVTNDTESIKQNIESFVNAYNDVVNYVSSNSTYDADRNRGGPFHGESVSRGIIDRLRKIATSSVSGLPDDLKALSQIGISTNYKDGTLSIDSGTLDDKLSSDLDKVKDLFTDSTAGIANQIYDYIDDEVTDFVDGVITIRVNGLESVIDDISDDITDFEARLEKREEELRRQFASLEALLGGLNAQGAFLSNQFAMLQNNGY